MGPCGNQNFKTLLLPQITFESSRPFPEFSSQLSSERYCFWIFEILSFWFRTFTIVPYGETKTQLSGKLETVERNGVKFGPGGEYSVYTGYFLHLSRQGTFYT